ncbi:hypothetical protein NFI96_008931, partial [Prochilodus magdalenae]
TLQMLYKLKTSKVFEKPKGGEVGRSAELVEEDPYAVQMVSWCPQSRVFCVVGISAHVILYRFSKHDANTTITSLEVRLQCEMEDVISPSDTENTVCVTDPGGHSPQPPSPRSNTPDSVRDSIPCLRVKDRVIRMPPGYQAELVVQLLWVDGEPPQQITSLDLNSAYGLLAIGNCNGLAVVDYLQKTVILCMSTVELYGSADPFQRLTRSPRKNRQSTSVPYPSSLHNDPRGTAEPVSNLRASHYSPVFYLLDNDHVNGQCTSPTSQPCVPGRPRVPGGPEGPRLTRRGPGRPPFRKAQSAACMEVSLPVSSLTEERRQRQGCSRYRVERFERERRETTEVSKKLILRRDVEEIADLERATSAEGPRPLTACPGGPERARVGESLRTRGRGASRDRDATGRAELPSVISTKRELLERARCPFREGVRARI